MLPYTELARHSNDELAARPIDQVHLACAVGLPGAERLDAARCGRVLDEWAAFCRAYTERVIGEFDRDPAAFEHSRAKFQIMAMVTALQRGCGVCYRPELINASDENFFRNVEHLFLHGVTEGKGGSCPSLPVVYVAVGRRLGYPLKLVTACRHLFARWEQPGGERFNIECTCKGFVSYPDEHYMTWRHPLRQEDAEWYGALRSLTPRLELAEFLMLRGHCLCYNGNRREAVGAYAWANEVSPDYHGPHKCLVDTMNAWDRQLRSRMMPGWPPLRVHMPPRKWTVVCNDIEQGIWGNAGQGEPAQRPQAGARVLGATAARGAHSAAVGVPGGALPEPPRTDRGYHPSQDGAAVRAGRHAATALLGA